MKTSRLGVLISILVLVVSAYHVFSYIAPYKKSVGKLVPSIISTPVRNAGLTVEGAVILSGLLISIILILAIGIEASRIASRFSMQLKEDLD